MKDVCVPLYLFQYVFVSLLSRDSVYDVLRRICTHLQVTLNDMHHRSCCQLCECIYGHKEKSNLSHFIQVNGKKSLSLKQFMEEPNSLSLVSLGLLACVPVPALSVGDM